MKHLKCLFLVVLLLFTSLNIKAQEESYLLIDYRDEEMVLIDSFNDLSRAYEVYEKERENYDNLVLYEDDKVLLMEHGMVIFKSDEACSILIDLNSEMSFNPCYAKDALYLSSESDLNNVAYYLSGEKNTIDPQKVELAPYSKMSLSPSRYSVHDQKLYHDIKNQWELDYFAYHALVSAAPSYLEDENYYYSYDGKYFYDSFKTMSDDLNKGTYKNAINAKDPFYNYYAYLSARAMSNYSAQELKAYFNDTLDLSSRLNSYHDKNQDGANDVVNRSQLADSIEDFFANQYLYGANALLLLAISINESAYGKSQMAYSYNNLFGDLALSSKEERASGRYESIASSIYNEARYIISNRNANYRSDVYNGTFLGSPLSGLGVNYSSDPYWSEKVAGIYYDLDASLGFKDANFKIAIKDNDKTLYLYRDQNFYSYYYAADIKPFALLVLEEGDDYYKVALEPSFSDDDRYDFESVAYVKKNGLKVLGKGEEKEAVYHTVTFKALDGTYKEGKSVSYQIKEGLSAAMSTPSYKGYEFVSYDKELGPVFEDTTYEAVYKKIDHLELIESPGPTMQYSPLNIDGLFKVVYEDGSEKVIDINSDMISDLDTSQAGEKVLKINYCGMTLECKVNIDDKMYEDYVYVSENLETFLKEYEETSEFDKSVLVDLLGRIKNSDYPLSASDIRALDSLVMPYYEEEINFAIDENDYGLTISGMSLAFDFTSSLTNDKPLFKDTYRVSLNALSKEEESALIKAGEGYGLKSVAGFELLFYRNFERITPSFDQVVALSLENLDSGKSYAVYYLEDGVVYKCKSSQSKDKIEFIASSDGPYMIYEVDSANSYDFVGKDENLTLENSDEFYIWAVVERSLPLFFMIVDEVLIVIYLMDKKKRYKLWNDYKKSLQRADFVQDAKPKN